MTVKATRIPASDIRIGETVISVGGRDIGSKLMEVRECRPGQSVAGPRGGRYRLTAYGAAERIVLHFANDRRPITARSAAAVVLRAEEN